MLAFSLIKRLRLDLTAVSDDNMIRPHLDGQADRVLNESNYFPRRWLAHPRTLRLSTRPRPPLNPDGTRPRTFTRISKSSIMPLFVLNLENSIDELSDKLVAETLLPLFRRLHPEKSGWNLSLVNVCATNMVLTASDGKKGAGRDIGRMLQKQDDVLKDWKIDDVGNSPVSDHYEPKQWVGHDNDPEDVTADHQGLWPKYGSGSEDIRELTQQSLNDDECWSSEDQMEDTGEICNTCGAVMPPFAMVAHARFHALSD